MRRIYIWRSKYGGMEVSEAKRLKQIKDENAQPKRLLAGQMMGVATLREMLGRTSEAQPSGVRSHCSSTRGSSVTALPELQPSAPVGSGNAERGGDDAEVSRQRRRHHLPDRPCRCDWDTGSDPLGRCWQDAASQ